VLAYEFGLCGVQAMPLIINTNVSALNAQRQLVKSGQDMSQAMERLSSGKRINGAGDDAAGMAIASRMTSQIRGLNQAIRNANDGISLIQTAGGALEESTNILQRMRELAIQSANGIYTDANRVSLNAEVEQLKEELTRIATTTSFNGLKILDGTLGDIDLQIGTEANETITLQVGSGFDAESLGKTESSENTGTFTLQQAFNAADSGEPDSLNALSTGDLIINDITIPPAELFDSVSTSDRGASALGISDAINSVSDQTGVVATAVNTVDMGTITVTNRIELGELDFTEYDDTDGITFNTGELVIDGIDFAGVTIGAGTLTDKSVLINEINAYLEGQGSDVVLAIDTTDDKVYATTPNDTLNIYSNKSALANKSIVDLGEIDITATSSNSITIPASKIWINEISLENLTIDTTSNQTIVDSLNSFAPLSAAGISFGLDDVGDNLFAITDGPDSITIWSSGSITGAATFALGSNDLDAGADFTVSTAAVEGNTGDINGGDFFKIGTFNFDANAGENASLSSAQTLNAGDFTINNVDITGTYSSADQLARLINTKTSDTGVTAQVDADGNFSLSSIDGRNIEFSHVAFAAESDYESSTSFSKYDLTSQATTVYTGEVTLSGSSIVLGGNDTSGFASSESVKGLQHTSVNGAAMTLTVATAGTANTTLNFSINGTAITAAVDVTEDPTNSDQADFIANQINLVSDQTGVNASVDNNAIVLTTGTGNPINLVTQDPSGTANEAPEINLTSTSGSLTLADDGLDIFDAAGDDSGDVGTHSVVETVTTETFQALTNSDLTINGYTVNFGSVPSSETSIVSKGASAYYIANAINTTEGLKDQVTAKALTVMNLGEVLGGTAEDNFALVVNGRVIDIDNKIEAGDASSNLVGSLNASFAAAESTNPAAFGLVASVNENNELLITADDGRNITVSVPITNTDPILTGIPLNEVSSFSTKGTVTLTANTGFRVEDIGGRNPGLAGISEPSDAIANIDISTQDGAQAAITVVDRALEDINNAIGSLGAANNRLDFTVSNLASVSENTSAARSRIMDADFAAETSMLSRAQVLQQASQAMLAQANALPQQVLRLLQ